MSRQDLDIGGEVFEAAHDALEEAISKQPCELVVLGLIVDRSGEYVIVSNKFLVTRPDIYQAIGLLEQMKLDLLASVPTNRPLREPALDGEDEDDDLSEPIGQA